jgi:hypothetical protein
MILESPAKILGAAPKEAFLPTVQRSSRVIYSAAQMFDLVNDIERVSEFLHWCRAARRRAARKHDRGDPDIGVPWVSAQLPNAQHAAAAGSRIR